MNHYSTFIYDDGIELLSLTLMNTDCSNNNMWTDVVQEKRAQHRSSSLLGDTSWRIYNERELYLVRIEFELL